MKLLSKDFYGCAKCGTRNRLYVYSDMRPVKINLAQEIKLMISDMLNGNGRVKYRCKACGYVRDQRFKLGN